MLLTHAGVEFEDEAISIEEWFKGDLKKEMLLGQLPKLQVGDKSLYQSMAIYRYLGRRYGYYPADPDQQYEIDLILETIIDYREGELPLDLKILTYVSM